MMASRAAAAMFPNLAAKERDELPRRNGKGDQPGWATSSHPAWSEPREVPNRFDRIPGLKRKSNR
jgi:hypothetical protein